MRLRPALPLLLAASALAACSQQAEEQAAPTPTPTLTTQALPTQAVDGTPLAVGEWLIEETGGGASARFREQGGADALVLVCDRANRALSLSRAGTTAQPQRFRITVGAQKADVLMAPGGALGLTAQVDGTQPIFAAFADPAAAIELTGQGAAPLRVPGHPGISRVFAACG
jgi:hypothetical protein